MLIAREAEKSVKSEALSLMVALAVMVVGAFLFIAHNYSPTKAAPGTPAITSITPDNGPVTGGNTVIVTYTAPDTNAKYVDVSASYYSHACGVLVNGEVACWGKNNSSQLGLGPGNNSTEPTPKLVVGLTGDAVKVEAGYDFTCALISGGTVDCWGRNDYYQTGYSPSQYSTYVNQVAGLSGVVALSAGYYHSCALKNSGNVTCWGGNTYYQLGDGTTSNRVVAGDVAGIANATAVAAGKQHSCAIVGGQVYCWGGNDSGQLGDGTTTTSPTPVLASGITNAVSITAGTSSTCAVTGGGDEYCWGYTGLTASLTPTLVPGSYVQVSNKGDFVPSGSSGNIDYYSHTCSVTTDQAAVCWGANTKGQLGNGTDGSGYLLTNSSGTPVQVQGLTAGTVQKIATGNEFTCALMTSGTIMCWGYDYFDALGNGVNNVNFNVPVAISDSALGITNEVTSATLGGLPCTNLTVLNRTQFSCVAPAHAEGKVDVSATFIDGTISSLPLAYEYIQPRITGISPDSGGIAGGNTVTITGTGFMSGTQEQGYACTKTQQTFTAPVDGKYTLETWGASAGYYSNANQGSSAAARGGYSSGVVELNAGDTLYAYVGCAGGYYSFHTPNAPPWVYGEYSNDPSAGGWNGGGDGAYYAGVADQILMGGGGGTDIRLVGGNWDDNDGLYSRIIVAGGGGGGGSYIYSTNFGGYGGGENASGAVVGDDLGAWSPGFVGYGGGGTQTAGGTAGYYVDPVSYYWYNGDPGEFGKGASSRFTPSHTDYAVYTFGGGGGWYGGGTGTGYYGGITNMAGGGSGYVLTGTSYKPAGYTPDSKYYLSNTQLLAGNLAFFSPGGGVETGHFGDGYARITSQTNLMEVTIDGLACTNLRVISDTEATCVVPAHVAGKVDVTGVFSSGERSTLPLGYEYIADKPIISPPSGGPPVNIPGVPNTGRHRV